MKTETIITAFLMIIILASCTSADASVPSTFASVPTAATNPLTLTPIPTTAVFAIARNERTNILLHQDIDLFSGPSNADFEVIKTLKTGETVFPLGIYGDFMQVEINVGSNDIDGFIYKNSLSSIPSNVPELKPDLVPWKRLFYPSCSTGVYDLASNTVTFTNQGDGYYDTETKAFKLGEPLRVKVDSLSVKGASSGSFNILGIPETQEPWWKGITRLDLANNNGYYQIGVRNGTSEDYIIQWDLPIQISQPIEIIFEQQEGKSLVILNKDNGEIQINLTKYLPSGLFPQGNAYFGTSTYPYSSLILKGLTIGELSNGKWIEQTDIRSGLAKLAQEHHLTIGTEFLISNMMDSRYCQIMKRDFNLAVLSFSSRSTWLSPGQYDFSSLDRTVDYANQQSWYTRISHLVWGKISTIPNWLLKSNFTKEEYIKLLEQHVKTVVKHFKDRVKEWSIANEAISRSFYSGLDFWNDKIGPDYIEMAFRWAKESDPNSILIFNNNNNESPRDRDTSRIIEKMYTTVKELKEKGVPIDVVGMQMHLLLEENSIAPKKDDVIATMRKFADLGVRIYITEFDVDLTRQPGTQTEKWEYEAQLYRNMLEACLESGVCNSFTTWGVSDSTSWITCEYQGCEQEPNGDPLMFDREFKPKPAYFAIRNALLNFSMPDKP